MMLVHMNDKVKQLSRLVNMVNTMQNVCYNLCNIACIAVYSGTTFCDHLRIKTTSGPEHGRKTTISQQYYIFNV